MAHDGVMGDRKKIFLIATEPSGDDLGAALMKELRGRLGDGVQFLGIGGAEMGREGLTSLFPIGDLAIVGFAGVAKQLPMLLGRIREAAAAVIQAKPNILVIIDSPDFTHRVARRVRKAAPSIPIVDYVSPTVWVWRPGRARAMTHYVDHVLAVLPFEPDVHRNLGGPPCTYIGHPLVERLDTLRPNAQERVRRENRRRCSCCCRVAVAPKSVTTCRCSAPRWRRCASRGLRLKLCCRLCRIFWMR